jgi:hypothetical protein
LVIQAGYIEANDWLNLIFRVGLSVAVGGLIRDVPLNKVPGVLIAVGCIREAMHHWESRQLVPYFLACPLVPNSSPIRFEIFLLFPLV